VESRSQTTFFALADFCTALQFHLTFHTHARDSKRASKLRPQQGRFERN